MPATCLLLATVLVFGGIQAEPDIVGVWEATTPKNSTVIYEFNVDSSIVWTTLRGDEKFVIKGTYAVDFTRTPVWLDLFDFEVLEYPEESTPPPSFDEWRFFGIIEIKGNDVMRMTAEFEREPNERPRDFTDEVVEFKRVRTD